MEPKEKAYKESVYKREIVTDVENRLTVIKGGKGGKCNFSKFHKGETQDIKSHNGRK